MLNKVEILMNIFRVLQKNFSKSNNAIPFKLTSSISTQNAIESKYYIQQGITSITENVLQWVNACNYRTKCVDSTWRIETWTII